VLAQEVKDFTRQEGQHTMVHNQFNARLQAQGIPVDRILRNQRDLLNGIRRRFPAVYTLGQTAAAEHVTAIMAHGFFDRREVLERTDPRVRAMYAWHAIEEIEHKAVAFDVLQKVAGAGYFTRMLPMLVVMLTFPLHVFLILGFMLRVDGFSAGQRLRLWLRGLWWLYGPGGLFPPVMGHLFAYFRPGFHPWKEGPMRNYGRWVDTYDRTGDPVAAGDALHAAGS
jgi:predicted metal-dependent hydrolase